MKVNKKQIIEKLGNMAFSEVVEWEQKMLRKTEDGSLSPEERMKASEIHSIIGKNWITVAVQGKLNS